MPRLEFRPATDAQTGVVLTHGNHPDSAQLGVDGGRPWLRIGGELVTAGPPLRAGQWHRLAARITGDGAELSVDGARVGWTRPWWGAQRWTSTVDGQLVVVTDRDSPAVSVYAFATAPDELDLHGGGALARWVRTVEPDDVVELGVVLFRVAGRGVANRDSLAGAAATEAILTGLFGLHGRAAGHPPLPAVPGTGALHHPGDPEA